MNSLIKSIEAELLGEKKEHPAFKAGDTLRVHLKIKEGNKERTQKFEGVVIQVRNPDKNGATFTVRKISDGVGVEKIFPFNLSTIEKIEVIRYGAIRRARPYYLRNKYGKAAKVKEKRLVSSKK